MRFLKVNYRILHWLLGNLIAGWYTVQICFISFILICCIAMQNPLKFSDVSTYQDSRLIRLWRNWMQVSGSMPLDKWLKHNLRDLGQLSLAGQASLVEAMNNAVRFQQLACALEYFYQRFANNKQAEVIDWLQWDIQWQTRDLQQIPMAAFWFWIQLRVTADGHKQNVGQLSDFESRNKFFQGLLEEKYFSQANEKYLWLGLRPQWQALIDQRKTASAWTDAQLDNFLQLQTGTPPLWLRVQSNQSSIDLQASLSAQGVNANLDEQGNIYLQGGRGVSTTLEFKNGDIEIQDLASQLIARAIDVKPGHKVWDACAGAGGKTLAIAAQMNNKGAVIATDLHDYKLEELKRRAKRAGRFNVRTFTWDGATPLRLPKEVAQQQGFDWVLIDAPCTSAGTWRRNPDARWRFDEADTRELIQLQQKILRNAAPAVRSGGYLVYATCSWQVSENERQVDWFLQQHPQFELHSQRIVGAPELDADTMFVSILKHMH